MTLYLPEKLPAYSRLLREGARVSTRSAARQLYDDSVLRIGLINLMPDKVTTEVQFARQIAASGRDAELVLLRPADHVSKNTAEHHLRTFYKPITVAPQLHLDGLIITGAPVEMLAFENVDYWLELTALFDWINASHTPALFICWAAQAALYHYHGVQKHALAQKASGVFQHQVFRHGSACVEGLGTQFPCPVSRHTEVRWSDLMDVHGMHVAAASRETGVGLVENKQDGCLFMFNHLEYDADTLAREYARDHLVRRDVAVPANYFPDDDPEQDPDFNWAQTANGFFSNWIAAAERCTSRTAPSRVDSAA